MQKPLIDMFISQLDLAIPGDVRLAFHFARHWPATPPLNDSQFATFEHYVPLIFGQPDNDFTVHLVHDFLGELGRSEPGPVSLRRYRREWLCVFREAFYRTNIGPVALGAAYSFLLVGGRGSCTPGIATDSAEARQVVLADAKRASPIGMMIDEERAALAELPPIVELYRGGRGNFNEDAHSRRSNIYWTLNREYAERFMKGRGRAQTQKAIGGVLLNLSRIGVPALFRQPSTRRDIIQDLGTPYLLKARVPRELVIAYFVGDMAGKHAVEVILDFPKLTPDMIEDVTPEAFRWAA